jgi:hypothetical protein
MRLFMWIAERVWRWNHKRRFVAALNHEGR